jgi:hypothetical protein
MKRKLAQKNKPQIPCIFNYFLTMKMKTAHLIKRLLYRKRLFKPSAISVQSDTVLQMVIPTISIILVFALQSVNIWRNTSMKKAVISRAFNTKNNNITIMSKNEYYAEKGSLTVSAIANKKLIKLQNK